MTAVPEAQPLADAIAVALALGLAGTPIRVDVGERKGPPPCLVLHCGPGDVGSDNLADTRTRLDVELQLTAVGSGPEQATWAADKGRSALLTQTITVAGRLVSRPRQTQRPPAPYPDPDTTPQLWLAPVRYALTTDPA